MRWLFCFFAACLLTQTAMGQHLSFDELIMLRSRDAEGINSYLVSKGWEFINSTAETEAAVATATWGFGRDLDAEQPRATAFVSLWAMEAGYKKLRYQAPSKSYGLFKAQLIARKLKQIDSKVEDGQISATFIGENYKVELLTSTDKQSKSPIYLIVIERRAELIIPLVKFIEQSGVIKKGFLARQDSIVGSAKNLSEESLVNLKNKVGKQEDASKVEKFILLGKVNGSCSLFKSPADRKEEIVSLDKDEPVCLYSAYVKGCNDCYLVWANGYYGYIEKSNVTF